MKICSVCHRCYEDRAVHCADRSHFALLEPHDGDIEMIAGYRIEHLSHSGVRDEAYAARHVASERSCLIRIIRGEADRAADFLRDAEIATSLFHPNVVDTYEAGQLESGDLFVVTEESDGQSLREMITSGPPDLLPSIRIATEAAMAIHTMHLKSLLHRAIRPENIVISRDEQGELLVRIKDPDLGGIVSRSIVTDKFTIDSARDQLRYFAPEQCNNEPVSVKADVYSLGIVLYELLAGRTPFESPKASGLIEMHRHRRPAEIRIDDFELRMLVSHILMQSLSKHPSDRQSSANALARQLRHVEQLATHVSTPPPAGKVPPEPLRTSPRIHVSDAGDSRNIPAVPSTAEHTLASEAPSPKSTGNKGEPVPDPIIEPRPIPNIVAEKSPSIRQRLSRLTTRLQRPPSAGLGDFLSAPESAAPRMISTPDSRPIVLGGDREQGSTVNKGPIKIHWDQPDDDLPPIEAVLAARSEIADPSDMVAEHPAEMSRIEDEFEAEQTAPVQVAAAAASAGASVSTLLATSHHEADEITAAPARANPIRIDIPAPKAPADRKPVRRIAPSPDDESSFFPTALVTGRSQVAAGEVSASILSSYYSEERSYLPIQKVPLAAGLVATAAAVIIFNNAVWKHFSDQTVEQTMSAATVQNPAQQAPVALPQTAVRTRPVKYFDSPQPKANSPAPSDARTEPSTPSANKNRSAGSVKADKNAVPRPGTSDRAKNGAKPEPQKRGPDRALATAANKPTATTRPRIVKNPRP